MILSIVRICSTDGITRLETGFSKASASVLDLICDAWGINRKYLLAGQGEMFELQPYCDGLVTLLKKYLAVATFDRKGKQYWKGSLVDDLERLIDVGKLNGREMCRVVRVLYDYVDVEQFAELLERMGISNQTRIADTAKHGNSDLSVSYDLALGYRQ